jgi:hypothetical protein
MRSSMIVPSACRLRFTELMASRSMSGKAP